MSWEDCCFSHTPDNRFKNTVCNRWNCIKDDETRTFTSKGAKPRGAIREEIGGAGYGYGKRPYFYDDYQEMIKATPDKVAFDRMAARGYFPGRALLERPYGSKHYQDMKYQKPVSELTATTSVKEDYAIPEFEIPKGIAMEIPMWIHGYICISDVSKVKISSFPDETKEGIEIYDGHSASYCKEGLISENTVNILIYNCTQLKQQGSHLYVYVFDSSIGEWRICTAAEGGPISSPLDIVPGADIFTRAACPSPYYLVHIAGYNTDRFWSSKDYITFTKILHGQSAGQFQSSSASATGQHVYFGQSRFLYSNDYGDTWIQQDPPGGVALVKGIACSATGGYVLACIDSITVGHVARSIDYGATWAIIEPASGALRWNLAVIGGAYWLAGIDNGRLYLSSDYGVNWSQIYPAGAANKHWLYGCASIAGSLLIAVNSSYVSGNLYYSTNGGSNWTAVNPMLEAGCGLSCAGVACSADGKYVLCSTSYVGASYPLSGYTYLSSDYGVTWTRTDIPKPDATTSAGSTPSISYTGQYMMVHRNWNGIALSDDYGSTWTCFDPTDGDNSCDYGTIR